MRPFKGCEGARECEMGPVCSMRTRRALMMRESHLRVMPNLCTAQWSSESTGAWSATAIGTSPGSRGRFGGDCESTVAEEEEDCGGDLDAEESVERLSGTKFGFAYTWLSASSQN